MSEELKNQPAVDTGAAEEVSEQVAVRMDKMHKLEEKGILPFGHAYKVTHHNKEVHDKVKELEEKGAEVRVAGRLTAIRGHGKTAFMDLLDKSGKIQLYVRKDELGEDNYSVVKLLDIGDIVGVEGEVFTTHMGEPSIRVKKLEFLSKALKPLPEKWHGLKDKEIRYRQRYVDLIVNPEVRDTFVKRTEIIKSIRNILDNEGYLEVETPVLNTISGGATARPFVTHHNALDIDLYLRIATELNLKRLIVGGLERVYEIGRIFRNEGMDIKHNPEFTSIELYEAYGDYQTMMDITEKLVSETAQRVLGTMKITYQGKEIDLTPPWPRMTMVEAVKKFSGYDFTGVRDVETARKLAADANVEIQPTFGPGKILEAFFDEFVEKNLIQPTFIMGHPKEISPLAKSSLADPEVTDRFEGFINGSEICNGFTELNDPIDQKERFEKQVEERNNGDDEAGMRAVNAFCASHGYSSTSMGRLLLQSNEYGDNYTSVSDCGHFLKEIYQSCADTSSDPILAHAEDMYALLKQQQRSNKIPADLPEGVKVANKTGELSNVENDAGILYDTNSGNDLVICFLSENLTDTAAAQSTIAQLSRTIYLTYNG